MRAASEVSPCCLKTTAGSVELPLACHDGSMLGHLYAVDVDSARAALPAEYVEPVTWWSRAFALIVAFEYRSTTIGPYNELGVAVLAKRRGAQAAAWRALIRPKYAPDAGWFVVSLPVTTVTADACGREIWGYPKYLTEIQTEFTNRRARAVLKDELLVEHQAGWRIPLPSAPFATLSIVDGQLMRTLLSAKHRLQFQRGRPTRRIIGDGPTSMIVRQLDLEQRRPLVTFRTDKLRTWLPAGEPLTRALARC